MGHLSFHSAYKNIHRKEAQAGPIQIFTHRRVDTTLQYGYAVPQFYSNENVSIAVVCNKRTS